MAKLFSRKGQDMGWFSLIADSTGAALGLPQTK